MDWGLEGQQEFPAWIKEWVRVILRGKEPVVSCKARRGLVNPRLLSPQERGAGREWDVWPGGVC